VGTLGIINHKEHFEIFIKKYNKTKEHKLSTKWKNIGNSIWELYWEQVGGAKSLNSKYLQVPLTLARRSVQLIKAHLVGCLQNLTPLFFFFFLSKN
jgi:hypothetical protein